MARTFTDEQRKVHKAKQAAKRLAKAVDMKVLLSEACVHTGVDSELKDRGLIQSWTFKRLKKCDIRALILGRLETRPDDNIVIFGRAKRTQHMQKTLVSVRAARKKAMQSEASADEVVEAELEAYIKRSADQSCVADSHAAAVRVRTDGSVFVDAAMGVAKRLTLASYMSSMAESWRNKEKQALGSRYYLFRLDV